MFNDNDKLCTDIDKTCIIPCQLIEDPKHFITDEENTFKIISFNIRSVNKNLDDFLIYIANLKAHPDFIVLSECWCNDISIPPQIDGYNMYFTKHSFNQNDGVIMYIKDDITASVHEVNITEANCLAAKVGNMTVLGLYRPYCFKDATPFLNSLDTTITTTRTRNLVLTGDINIDILNTSNKTTIDYLDIIASHGLSPAVYLSTHGKTCLDHFMCKVGGIPKSYIFITDITDHFPILLSIPGCPTQRKITCGPYIRTKINYEAVEKCIEKFDWNSFLTITDTNDAANTLINILQEIIITNTETITISRKRRPMKPWITPSLLKCFRKRDRLHMLAKKYPEDLTTKLKYTSYRNTCKNIIKKLKISYYKTKLLEQNGNKGGTWNILKEICNLTSKKNVANELLNMRSPIDSLNVVNNYFTNVGSNLAKEILNKLSKSEEQLTKLIKPNTCQLHSMPMYLTNTNEIKGILAKLKSNSAPGQDQIPVDLLKKNREILCLPIEHVCNLSLKSGIFPESFKVAIVIPIFKSGEKEIPSNYRPISLFSTLSKILEKVVNTRLIKYLEKENLLAHNQFGFRVGRSTEDAVLSFTNLLSGYMDQGKKCVGVFLDLKKAFDTISIPLLIVKLEDLGIRGTPLNWFKDYLKNRSQIVRVAGFSSKSNNITHGIPQGSTLGPTLFLAYINNLCMLEIINGHIFVFADDTAILFHGSTWQEVQKATEQGIRKITSNLEANLLTVNATKTKFVCFNITEASQPPQDFKLKLHTYPCNTIGNKNTLCTCENLEQTPQIKYLGIIIDKNLKWLPQIKTVAKRVRSLIPLFKYLRDVVDKKLLFNVYTALCQSLLIYCIAAWGGAAASHMIDVERAQRAVIKVMLHKPRRYSSEQLYKESQLLTIRQLFILHAVLRHHSSCPILQERKHRRKIYNALPFTKTTFARRQYFYLGPYLYRYLVKKIKINQLNRYRLKKSIKNFFTKYNYENTEKIMDTYIVQNIL